MGIFSWKTHLRVRVFSIKGFQIQVIYLGRGVQEDSFQPFPVQDRSPWRVKLSGVSQNKIKKSDEDRKGLSDLSNRKRIPRIDQMCRSYIKVMVYNVLISPLMKFSREPLDYPMGRNGEIK